MDRARLLLTGACAALLAGPTWAAEIETLEGSFDEQVRSITVGADGAVTLETPRRRLPLEAVKTIRFQDGGLFAAEGEPTKLVLTNGDVLVGTVEAGDEDAIGFRSDALGALVVPLELVRAVIPRSNPERDRALLGRLRDRTENDSVRLDSGGTVRGLITRMDGTQIVIDTNTPGGSNMETLRFDFARVDVVTIALLEAPPAPPEGLHLVVRMTDGSALRGKVVRLRDNLLALQHPLAGGADRPLELALARVVDVAVQNGLFVYLSDLEPSAAPDQRFPPEFSYEVDVWGYKRDRNVTGGELRLGGREFAKGLGVHSYCALTYDLGGRFEELRAVIGLDDSTRYLGEPGFGAVVFRVLIDGKPAREYPSGITKRKGDDPTELVVKVAGRQTLTLVADFDPTSLHVLGRGNWADAHLIRAR